MMIRCATEGCDDAQQHDEAAHPRTRGEGGGRPPLRPHGPWGILTPANLPRRDAAMSRRLPFAALALLAVAADQPAPTPLKNAHAHNDYLHPRPLFDALDQGFTSVEVDVFLVNGQLLVGHTAA